jgi:hypothetical protein
MSRPAVPPVPDPVLLSLPLPGPSRVQNSPADRVPSHGTHAFGSGHAIDLVPVGEDGRSAPGSWRALLATEPPARFVGFGRPVLAPAAGTVVLVHDGETDHPARRSLLAGVPYLLSQQRRARGGAGAIAGNHVVVAVGEDGPFLLLAHLQRGSIQTEPGQHVAEGVVLGRCGNSGNSTEPHVHLQLSDSTDWGRARGLPFAFRRADGSGWLPRNGETVHRAG